MTILFEMKRIICEFGSISKIILLNGQRINILFNIQIPVYRYITCSGTVIENQITLLCEENGKIYGFCFGKIMKKATPTLKTIADIDDIFVEPQYRKRGIATLLYKEFEKTAKQGGSFLS